MYRLVLIIGLICSVWVIYDLWTTQRHLSNREKLAWTIFAIAFSVITAAVYFTLVRKRD